MTTWALASLILGHGRVLHGQGLICTYSKSPNAGTIHLKMNYYSQIKPIPTVVHNCFAGWLQPRMCTEFILILSPLTISHWFFSSDYCHDVTKGRLGPKKCPWGLSPALQPRYLFRGVKRDTDGFLLNTQASVLTCVFHLTLPPVNRDPCNKDSLANAWGVLWECWML